MTSTALQQSTFDKAETRIMEESLMITTVRNVNPHRDTTKIATTIKPGIYSTTTKGYILSQKYLSPANNKVYVAIGPENVEKELFRRMVEMAIKLKDDYRRVKGMVSRV